MSDEGQSETAIVAVVAKPFQMPNFKGRDERLKSQLKELLKSTNLDVKDHVEKEVNKAINHLREKIEEGEHKVTSDQKDLEKINLRIVAINKKTELERKIKHMGINEAVLRKGEMEEKLRLLNENIKYLATDEDRQEEARDEDGNDDDDEGAKLENNKGKNRRSVDVIRNLEDQLGLPISTKNARVMHYKDQMHMSKEDLLKSQASAEQFVAKMREKQKEVKVNTLYTTVASITTVAY
jgi:hypothetical protein